MNIDTRHQLNRHRPQTTGGGTSLGAKLGGKAGKQNDFWGEGYSTQQLLLGLPLHTRWGENIKKKSGILDF